MPGGEAVLAASLPPPAAGGASPTPDLLWYKFSENTGTSVNDDSTLGTHDLTLSNSGMWVAGKTGYGIQGNGSSYSASTASFNANTNKITVCFWMNPTSWSDYEYLIELSANASGNDNSLAFDSSAAVFELMYQDGTGTDTERHGTCATSVLGTGTWKHVAAVFDTSTSPGTITLYVDGSSQSLSMSGNGGASTFGNYTLYILARNNASYFCNDKIDDLRIYSGDQSASLSAIIADPQ